VLSFDPKLPITLPAGWTAEGYANYVHITAPSNSRTGPVTLTASEHMRDFALGRQVLTRNGEKYQGRGWRKRLYDDAVQAMLAAGAIVPTAHNHMRMSPLPTTPETATSAPEHAADASISSSTGATIVASSGPVTLLAQPVYDIKLAMPGISRNGHGIESLTRSQIADLATALTQLASVISSASPEEAKTLGYAEPVKAQSGEVEVFATLDDDQRGDSPEYFLELRLGDRPHQEFIGVNATAITGLANSFEQLRMAIK
jgi:hypothetical protein